MHRLDDGNWEVTTSCEERENSTFYRPCGLQWPPLATQISQLFWGVYGEFLHSHQFKKAAPFKDKKVLVIGGGIPPVT